ncbi:MAG: glycosyltransferase [Deltaproteobacteria bacterium]|nr:glycosyltransferase [Deltaproteobacteria bacterium]
MDAIPKDRLTVLHIFSGDLWAGAEVMVYNLCGRLKEAPGLDIMALSMNEGVLTGKLRESGVETHVIPESENGFPVIVLKALRLLKGKKIDIIHSHRFKENLLALSIAKYKGVKHLVTTVHGLPEPPLNNKNGKNSASVRTRLHFFMLKNFFSRVIAVSNEMKQILVHRNGFRDSIVDVIYNGIPMQLNIPSAVQSADNFFRIGTVGRMVPVKDFNLFLEAAAEIKKHTANCRFSILGDGPLKEKLLRKAKGLGIAEYCDFLPPRPDPLPYYRSLDLYLNTSIHEGIPLSILEAMACGVPVVAPRVGGIPEIISNGVDGVLVDGRKPADFIDACMGLMEDSGLRTRIRENASKTIVKRFTDSTMAAAYLSAYRGLCPRHADVMVEQRYNTAGRQ